MAFSTKEQEIIKYGLANGKTKEQVTQALTNFRTGVVTTPKPVEKPAFDILAPAKEALTGLATTYGGGEQGIANKLKTDITEGAKAINEGNITGSLQAGFRTAGDVAGTVYAPIGAALQTTGINKVFDFIGKVSQMGGKYNPINAITDIKAVQDFVAENPHLEEDFGRALNLTLAKFDSGKIDPATVIPRTIEQVKAGIDTVKTNASNVINKVTTSPDEVFNSAKTLKDNIQLTIAKKNVNPQLENSANRLFLEGTQRLEDPVTTYDRYLTQSKKALTDIKTDPAISEVGSKMGDAFDAVVKQRQAVGKVLGEELKTNGKIKVNIAEPRTNLLGELKDSGLSYNPKTGKLTSFQGSKFAPEEVSMLNDFVNDINTLGDNPTVSQIDNFIAKTRATLQFTKGKSGVIGTTNAERIINGGVAKLRASLDPTVNGNKALTKYWDANKTYSELSDFVDEGSTFLGKKTLSGDYAKDASVAKSSVQSILNQGKKDFMVKLEALTGYPAIDEAVLALQAMKDAGDFRGLSLLQAMSDAGGIPTSKAGFTQKILDYAIQKGGEFVAGTPEQQTKALLQDLSNKAKSPSTTKPKATNPAKTGNSTSNIKNSNKATSKTIPEKSLKVKGEIPTTSGQAKITDPTLFERAKNLSPVNKLTESKAFDYVLKNEDKILGDYFKKYGKTVNTDNFRQFFKDYTGENSAAVQEPSSYLAKRARAVAMQNKGDYVVGTAGGSGVGKTSSAKAIPTIAELHNNAAFTLDSNFSTLKSAKNFINEVKTSGKDFIGVYTYREFMDSLENGIIKRMLTNKEEMGRLVPNKITAGNHVSSWDVVKQLNNEGEQFHFIDNSLGAGKAKVVTRTELESKIKYPPVEQLTKDANAIVKKLYESKKPFIDENGVKHFITKKQYDSLVE